MQEDPATRISGIVVREYLELGQILSRSRDQLQVIDMHFSRRKHLEQTLSNSSESVGGFIMGMPPLRRDVFNFSHGSI